MSFVRKMSSILKKAGYKKEYDNAGVKIFLRQFNERYSFGFAIYKLPGLKEPEFSAGLLDRNLGSIQGQVEGTVDLGLYHLSAEKTLYSTDFVMQGISDKLLDEAITVLQKQITFFHEQGEAIISDFKERSYDMGWSSYFYDQAPQKKMFGAIYRGLLFRLVENGELTDKDFEKAVSLANENSANSKNFQFKLGLLNKYLDENKLWG